MTEVREEKKQAGSWGTQETKSDRDHQCASQARSTKAKKNKKTKTNEIPILRSCVQFPHEETKILQTVSSSVSANL